MVIFYRCFLSAQQLIREALEQKFQSLTLVAQHPKRTLGISFPRIWASSFYTISTTSIRIATILTCLLILEYHIRTE